MCYGPDNNTNGSDRFPRGMKGGKGKGGVGAKGGVDNDTLMQALGMSGVGMESLLSNAGNNDKDGLLAGLLAQTAQGAKKSDADWTMVVDLPPRG